MPICHPSARAEQYQRLAQECWKLAKMLAPEQRATVLEMAKTWQRLAEEQGRATDLRKKE
jgi:hypothetical protein